MPQDKLERAMLNRLIRLEQPSAEGAKKEYLKPKSFKESIVRNASDAVNWLQDILNVPTTSRYNIVSQDIPYLRQYLHPEKNILPRQNLRPTVGSIPEGDVVRRSSIPDTGRTSIYDNVDAKIDRLNIRPVRVVRSEITPHDTGGLSGLGQYNATTSKDDKGKFLSVYDRWDFDTAPIGIKQIMGLLGKPFSVYDKFDISGEEPDIAFKRRK